jgi:pimeloyl-ACP methyl ester carboxylesterase
MPAMTSARSANPRPVRAPSRLLTAMETRAIGERLTMSMAAPILERLPRGDRHDVLVLPGFLGDDRSTAALRDVLDHLGYHTRGWGLGTNLGPTRKIVTGLFELFTSMAGGNRRVSIVGWSLGGVFGREVARVVPESVRQVITLGSPIHMVDGDRSAPSDLWDRLEHMHDADFMRNRPPERDRGPLPVPTTSVYTRTDGIVHWSTCLIERGPVAENVEVRGSHCGLGFNPAAVMVVADRLAQRDGEWARFRPPLCARALFPRPVDRRPDA